MPGFSKRVPHPHKQDDAVQRLKDFTQGVERKYADMVSEMRGDWQENVLAFRVVAMGLTVSGTLVVVDYAAQVEVQYPFAAALFSGRLQETITRELNQALQHSE